MERFGNISVFLLTVFILLIPAILFIRTIQKTLKAIAPHNRKFNPQQTWLLLIPLVGNVWSFIIAKKLSQSIGLELTERKVTVKRNPTFIYGLILAIIQVLAFIPYVNNYTRYPWFICWFIYWANIVEYKRKLSESASFENTILQ